MSLGFGNGQGPADVAACLMAAGPRHDLCTETVLVQSVAGRISHTLDTANGGKGCGEDGTGKGIPIIAFTAQDFGADAAANTAPTLRTKVMPAIAFAQNSRGELRWESGHGQIAGTLSTGGGKPGQGRPMVLSMALRGRDGAAAGDPAPLSLHTSEGDGVGRAPAPGYEAHFLCEAPTAGLHGLHWRVRRLMPRECERLQGMPDDYTQVPYRGKPAADAPRYKAIGNSMAVPCVAWLGSRLKQCLDNGTPDAAD